MPTAPATGLAAFLSVHEGPRRISPVGSAQAGGDEPLPQAGMVSLSNEPGYYKAHEYGIRIEKIWCWWWAKEVAGAEKEMLGFETLTFAPIERRLVVKEDAGRAKDLDWLNSYHAEVIAKIGPQLDRPPSALGSKSLRSALTPAHVPVMFSIYTRFEGAGQ